MGEIKELAVVGEEDFVLGFMLAGIKKIYSATETEELEEIYNKTLEDEEVGIIITSENALEKINKRLRDKLKTRIDPVTVSLSVDKEQDDLRNKIKRIVGADLLGGNE